MYKIPRGIILLAVGVIAGASLAIEATVAGTDAGGTARLPVWSLSTSPSVGSNGGLGSISCPTTTLCTSVGTAFPFGQPQELIETATARNWSLPPISGLSASQLHGVACTKKTCTAVGEVDLGGYPAASVPLVDTQSNGTWTAVSSPDPSNNQDYGVNSLLSISCPITTFCVAVGETYRRYEVPLIETLVNGAWSISSYSLNGANSGAGKLSGVSCTSATTCVAVGDYLGQTLIEVLSAGTWSQSTAPSPGSASALTSVSCPTSTSCVAVGNYSPGSFQATLIESLNSGTWTQATSLTPGLGAFLIGVSCHSAKACVAVGYSEDIVGGHPLIESLNSKGWSLTTPATISGTGELSGVSCKNAKDCVAVGQQVGGPLIEGEG